MFSILTDVNKHELIMLLDLCVCLYLFCHHNIISYQHNDFSEKTLSDILDLQYNLDVVSSLLHKLS